MNVQVASFQATVWIRAFLSECLNKTKDLVKRGNVIEVPARQYRNNSFAYSGTVPIGYSMPPKPSCGD